jgi:hypothetical protein
MQKATSLIILIILLVSCNREANNKMPEVSIEDRLIKSCLDTISKRNVKLFLDYSYGMNSESVDSLTFLYKKEKIIEEGTQLDRFNKKITIKTDDVLVDKSLMEIKFDYQQVKDCYYLTDIYLKSKYAKWNGEEFNSLLSKIDKKYKMIYKSEKRFIYTGESKIIELVKESEFDITKQDLSTIDIYEIHYTSVEEHNRRQMEIKQRLNQSRDDKNKREKIILDKL